MSIYKNKKEIKDGVEISETQWNIASTLFVGTLCGILIYAVIYLPEMIKYLQALNTPLIK
jgi:hypothetical protein